jgi:pyruvate dehydrogenase E2 component (dihydrolipoamide acetyltransferase)
VPDGPSIKGEVTTLELSRRERAIARRSAETRAVVPTVELSAEIDAGPALARERRLGCGTTALLVRACASALAEVPRANGAYRDGRIELYSRINIGVTIADRLGYEVPTVLDADRKTAQQIAAELAGFAERARDGLLTAPELSGATFTVTDSLAPAVASLSPLIVSPQAAALTAGAIRDVAAVHGGAVVAARAMTLTLAVDHRILFAPHAAAFLEAIKAHLEGATP